MEGEMKIAHVQAAKKYLGENIKVVADLFRASRGSPPSIPVQRYRADHPEWIDALDRLETTQNFLGRLRDNNNSYYIRVYALPVLDDPRARQLLRTMEALFQEFRETYKQRLTEKVLLTEIFSIGATKLKINDEELIKEALFYMADSHSVWSGLSNDFPNGEGAYICISESVLRHSRFSNLLSQFYEWHIVNAKKRAENANPFATLVAPATVSFKKKTTKKVLRRHRKANDSLPTMGASLPMWYSKLDDSKKALLSEIDRAVAAGLAALPTMGIRSLLEQIMREHVDEQRTFKENIDAFQSAGFVTKQHALLLEHVVNAGHAAIHRAYFPNPSDLATCFDTIKHLMEGVYILRPKVDEVVKNIPKRNE